MFLLAKLIVENLMQQACVEDVEDELVEDVLPRELKQAYARSRHIFPRLNYVLILIVKLLADNTAYIR